MGCPTEARLNERIAFSVCTHDPEMGGLADADQSPTYSLYLDESLSPFETGAMIRYSLGFYARSITCAQTGTYTVKVEATVSGETGGISFAFVVHTTPEHAITEVLSCDDTAASELVAVREMCANILAEVEAIKDKPEPIDRLGEDALIAAHLARLGQ